MNYLQTFFISESLVIIKVASVLIGDLFLQHDVFAETISAFVFVIHHILYKFLFSFEPLAHAENPYTFSDALKFESLSY